MRNLFLFFLGFIFIFSSLSATAATFTPTNAAQLQADLNTAAANGEVSNTILLAANTVYSTSGNGNSPFLYASPNSSDLIITGAGQGSTLLDGGGISNVMHLSTVDGDIRVSHLTVQNGMTGDAAGISLETGSGELVLEHAELKNNLNGSTGGARIVSLSGNISVNNNVLVGNQGTSTNGLYIDGTDGLTSVNENTIQNNVNSAAETGGIQLDVHNGKASVVHNTVTGNSAASTSGIRITAESSEVYFSENLVSGNGVPGPSLFGGVALSATGPVTFLANTILDNRADSIGGIGIESPEIIFINNIVAGNAAPSGQGGGAYLGSFSNFCVNNTVYDNENGIGGGGLSLFTLGTANIYNNIVFANSAPAASGQDILIGGPATSGALFNNDFGEACVNDGMTVNCDPTTVANFTTGANINVDPLFVDAPNANFNLAEGSQAIDAGDVNAPDLPATDHDGNPRVVNGQVDMGALEAQPNIVTDPASLDFGDIGGNKSSSLSLIIANVGSLPADVSGLVLSDTVNYSLDLNAGSDPCAASSFTLPGGNNCTLSVIFSPKQNGLFNATLTINSNDPDEPALAVPLSGSAQAGGGGCSLGAVGQVSSLWSGLLPFFFWGFVRLKRKSL